jgi:hypothetical protein
MFKKWYEAFIYIIKQDLRVEFSKLQVHEWFFYGKSIP